MRLFPSSPSLLRKSAVAGGAVALGLAVFMPAAASASPSSDALAQRPTINTFKSWDGSTSILPFGCPETSNYGETITVPKGKTEIQKVTFYMNDGGLTGSMRARGEIYAWDGTMATGSAIAETRAKKIDLPDANWHPVSFTFSGATVTPGSQYVVFATIDKNYKACTNNYTVSWGSTDGGAYTKGIFVYQNSDGDESQWTTVPWSQIGTLDAALKGYLS